MSAPASTGKTKSKDRPKMSALRKKKIATNAFISFVRFILLFGLCFMIIQPILNKISVSFMTEGDLYDPVVINIPAHFTTANYQLSAKLMNYKLAFKNSMITSLTIGLLQVAVCTLVGYGFARYEFPFKKFWFGCVLLMIIIPPQIMSTSLYLHFKFFDFLGIAKLVTGNTINLRGSVLPYYLLSAGCMGLKNGLYIYLIRQFFRNIPKELEEAAYVDGAGTLKTFVIIMLPDAKPILVSCFLFSFVWQWTDGFYSRMFLGNLKLVSTSLSSIADDLSTYIASQTGVQTTVSVAYSNCILSTGTLMIILPLIFLYLFAQKGFVESLSSTGIKM
ncbi:MAG: carbohydrate ABC transporter permease [Lachnospiraceae bacterium]|nr:carbohydrate ABC transporter permease [Lachnospiraceae bacterium]MBO7531529.1 carbohydrate ABC transporter permease [Lachnospiraceae bacterium]MBP5253458.1 carbohydrate ABC transporter permease [Lachnospiraceae bacterium]MBP5472804.1 carbohydrate ABC transporter permease [Lachnospiraceae bacterium]MBP5763214.1 carbohydrate ABC transporter permease [Lachnospiraceae bacterium]